MEKDYGPGVKLPPPVGVLIVIATSECINRFAYLLELDFYNIPMAIACYAIATALIAIAAISFRKHKTSIVPHKPDSELMTSGIFAISRNPIYLSFIIFQLMLAFVLHNLWQVILIPVSYLFLRYYVITKEERYLSSLFGKTYTNYMSRVRRWI